MTDSVAPAEDALQLVSFAIEGETFGIDILDVREIIRPLALTRVPNAPDFIDGVINLRGRVVPVVDLRARFGLPSQAPTKATRIVVAELGEKVVGFTVDAVREVLRVNAGAVEPAPDLAVGVDAYYIDGVARLEERLLILLDMAKVLARDDAVPVTSD